MQAICTDTAVYQPGAGQILNWQLVMTGLQSYALLPYQHLPSAGYNEC